MSRGGLLTNPMRIPELFAEDEGGYMRDNLGHACGEDLRKAVEKEEPMLVVFLIVWSSEMYDIGRPERPKYRIV